MHRQSESTLPSEIPPADGTDYPCCSNCPVDDCAVVDDPAEKGPEGSLLVGWRLGLVSTGLFLGPVVLAIIGAVSFGPRPGAQFAGAIAGLGSGLAGSVGIAAIVRRAHERSA